MKKNKTRNEPTKQSAFNCAIKIDSISLNYTYDSQAFYFLSNSSEYLDNRLWPIKWLKRLIFSSVIF